MQLSSSPASATAEAPGNDLGITFEDVQLAFEQNKVLRGVSFNLRRGETKVLLGIAGAGKSTILKLALGLMKPDSGRIDVLGEEVSSMEEEDLFALRRRVGMVFQESALFDSLTVEENVSYRLREEHAPEDEIKRRVVEALRFVELEHTLEKFPSELSGGMRRRVAIARAIVNEPEVILYDSPTGGLDPITSTRIIELVVKQRDVYKTSALLVTHRLQDAFTLASSYFDPKANEMRPVTKDNPKNTNTSFMILRDGKVIFDGNATELACTNDEYIREFIS
ncbi:MAG: transporter, ATPase subunit [Candidatus Angelobacter sp.]|jgi:phospholipid/cholesterol/gamma-HCH transport system ATP-binding protein|nr:transporter, ATPase subunit [Candidatus Angelobacter sp.]